MKRLLIGLIVSFLFTLKGYATDYYTQSSSATLAGNAGLSTNWTTNSDGTAGLGNVKILPSDNLFVLSGANLTVTSATTIQNLKAIGGMSTELNINAALTILGNLTGNFKRTGAQTIFIKGATSTLAFTEEAGSTITGGYTIQTNTATLSGAVNCYGKFELSSSGKLDLNGNLLNVHYITCDPSAMLIGSLSSKLNIETSTAASSLSSNLRFDTSNPGISNALSSLLFKRLDGGGSAWINVLTNLFVNDLTVGKNSSTGHIAVQDNATLTIKGSYLNEATKGISALASGKNRNLAFESSAILIYPNETAQLISDDSKVTINGAALKISAFKIPPTTISKSYPLLKSTIAGSFTTLMLPAGFVGTLIQSASSVEVEVTQKPVIYFTKSPSATLNGNTGPSTGWTTNADGITDAGNVRITETDNLYLLDGAKVHVSAATIVQDLTAFGDHNTELSINNQLTLLGNLKGRFKRTGTATVLIKGASSQLAFREAEGSTIASITVDNTTALMTDTTRTFARLTLTNNGKLRLNGQVLKAHQILSQNAAYIIGDSAATVAIETSTVAGSLASELYFDSASNMLGELSLRRAAGNNSVWVNLNKDLRVSALTIGANSSTGHLALKDNVTLSIAGIYTNTSGRGVSALASGKNRKLVLASTATLVLPNETLKLIQPGSNLEINGGTVKLASFSKAPTSAGQRYTLLTGATVTGSFANLILPSGYSGLATSIDTTVQLTINSLPPIYRTDNFDSIAIQSIWSTTAGNTISLSDDHLKNGSKSLKWNVVSGGKLTASSLKIPSIETFNWDGSGTRFYIYNKTASNDTLVVRFYDNTGAVKRVGRMLLNYTGWREYHRSLRFDFGNTDDKKQEGLPGFAYDKFELEYKPQSAVSTTILHLDAVSFIGIKGRRTPGPHMLPDLGELTRARDVNMEPLKSWLSQPDIPVTTVTNADSVSGWQTVKTRFEEVQAVPKAEDLQAAKVFVERLGLVRNNEGTLTGTNPKLLSFSESDLGTYGKWTGVLARAFLKGGDLEAQNKCTELVEYLINQGVTEGGPTVISSSAYTHVALFFNGFLDAIPVLQPSLKADVLKLLKWSLSYGQFYGSEFTPGYDVDYVNSKSSFAFRLGFAINDQNESIRELSIMKRFMERFTEFSEGTRDGFKVDGSGFHHNNLYPNYMYNINLWLNQVGKLKGTVYRINKPAYDRMSFVVKSLTMPASPLIPINKTLKVPYANTLSARHPFAAGLYVKSDDIKNLISVGADIIGQPVEPDLAAAYNYFFPGQSDYASVPATDFNHFHQYNYGQLGIRRSKKWVATMRGFTDKLWGTETYTNANRYGRYQSYGALEFTYDSTFAKSGYVAAGRGWDWNVAPGTTTVHLSWPQLRTLDSKNVDEFQKRSFAGALASGKDGVWAMDYELLPNENANKVGDLKFKKSVFAFDSIFVALGTGITATKTQGEVRTNLFQNAYSVDQVHPAFYLNSASGQTSDMSQDLPTSGAPSWLVNTVGTGYYLPPDHGTLRIVRGRQTSPDQSGDTVTYSANATKVWINHGENPTNQRYQFVAVPNVSPVQMQSLAGQFAAGNLYKVERQSDTLHAVKFLPQNKTGYAFFQQADNVGIGMVKSLSGIGLVMIKDAGNSASVSYTNPDLNTIDTTDHKFRTRSYTATLVIAGKWSKASSIGGYADPSVTVQGENTAITFIVRDGLKVDVELRKIVSAQLKVVMQDGDNGQTNNNHIKPNLKLINEGTNAVPYNELTIRYWLTAENFAGINTWIDFAEMGNSKVKMQYVPLTVPRANAFGYIEYSFEASAGILEAGGHSGQIQSRFANSDWSNLSEADDYSYQALANFAANDRVTAYRNGELVWGKEPDLVTPELKLRIESQNKNSNTNGNTMSTYLNLVNEGNIPVSYEDLSIRYWFTADGGQNLNHWIDYAKLGSGNIDGQFVGNLGLNKADTYFELKVKPILGMLYPLSSTGNIQYRITKTDWSNFNEINDYSFKTASGADTNSRITVYYKEKLVYGSEPMSVPVARMGVSSEAGTSLQAILLGNPVSGSMADVLVSGIQGDLLRMVLYNTSGEQIFEKQIVQARPVEQHSFKLSQTPGIYLLKISRKAETIVLKVIKP